MKRLFNSVFAAVNDPVEVDQSIHHFPVSVAVLCQDCGHVSNAVHQCPACAGEVLMNLSTIVNREELESAVLV